MHTRGIPDYFARESVHPYPDPGPPPPRFAVGDLVWALTLYRENLTKACAVCDGTGRVDVSGSGHQAVCPEPGCRFGSVVSASDVLLASVRPLTLGDVEARTTARMWTDDPDRETRVVSVDRIVGYMALETGVGSGQRWPEDRLFPSREEALDRAAEHGAVEDNGAYLREESRARGF